MTLMPRVIVSLMLGTGLVLAVAMVVGGVGCFIQTLASIQDQAFSLAPRVVAICIVFLVTLPWAVRNLRFDEDLGSQIHGYDLDFCLQVREAGRKVITADLKVVHHHSLKLVSDPEVWIQAHMRVAEKWEGRMTGVGRNTDGAPAADWKARARRAVALDEVRSAIQAFRRLVKDYQMLVDSHIKAVEEGREQRIQAIDMGRRGLHNEGAELMTQRLAGQIDIDFDTARRLFTLITVLHWKG